VEGISEEMRQEILLRDGMCQFCRTHKDLRVEYINPNRPEATRNHADNLTVICEACEEGWQRRGVKYMTNKWFQSVCKPLPSSQNSRKDEVNLRGLWSGVIRAGLALAVLYVLGTILF